MSLLSNILEWSTSNLTLWQRDAIRRLFHKQMLDQQDYEELYGMLKSANGLSDPKMYQAIPFAQTHLPTQIDGTTPVILKSIRDLKYVNRIAVGQKLEFCPNGITVIYGGNGTGKSGYSRVLKRACRARDLEETVHSNVFDPLTAQNIPEAIFDIERDGTTFSLSWNRDRNPPDELSTIAVFDSRCARAYLDNEQDVAYLPYGLDIVENFGQQVLPTLARMLNAEIGTVNTDIAQFADLVGQTNVGKMLTSLNETTAPEQVKKLATLTVYETKRIDELKRMLAESDPKSKAQALRLQSQRMNTLISCIDNALNLVENGKLDKLKNCDLEAEAAIKTESIAAEKFRAGESLLLGTGDEIWKSLFEAARRFSTELVYPDKPFPNLELNAQCPLCQQQLTAEATKRLQRFDDFIKQDTAKLAAEKCQRRESEKNKIQLSMLGFRLDSSTLEEIKLLNPFLPNVIENFEKATDARKTLILDSFRTHIWGQIPLLEDDPREDLKAISAKLINQANELEKASDEKQKKVFENEVAELSSRTSLALRLESVLNLIERIKIKSKLIKCKDELKTKAISDKAKEFANQAVTESLKTALDSEFQALEVHYIKTKLFGRAEQGKMKHKLILDLPVMKKLDEILSEGEQRAIAIGSFLAELHLAGHKGGIVFDDPVSSLDHHWRKNVVRRLVNEARQRQVIILTHDTVFLGELHETIKEQKVDHLIHHLEWKNGCPGNVQNGLPWEHKSCLDRLDKLEKSQKELEKNWPTYPNEEDRLKMRHEYAKLRATIERAIEDVVFNGVIKRYSDWINVGNLDKVIGFAEAEYKEIERLYKICCGVIDSHDPSSFKNASVPSPQQLGKNIADLKILINKIKARRKTDNATG
ncbi:MAG: AAA family ATPase [Candidatus Omnitrophica bacterium]|nr:AAA family ATPase [Candidatus Omnitrophota bacterium]